jgi:transcriptional regulator with GAF, ATPase, and Fis domain
MFEEIVGSSPALQTVLSSIVKVAPTDSTVLITGEPVQEKNWLLAPYTSTRNVPARRSSA